MISKRYAIMRERNDRDVTREALGMRDETTLVRGCELRDVRRRCGYSAREFAEYLLEINAPMTTARSVYRVEGLRSAPTRYVDALKVFVGLANFTRALEEIRRKAEERNR